MFKKSKDEFINATDILKNKLGVFYGAQVADLGCGATGHFVFKLSKLVGQEGLVYAVDILKMVLKNINNRADLFGIKNIKTVWSNLEKYGATEINDNSLNFALLVNILFQSKMPERIIREASRMLKHGGKLLVIDWRAGRFPFGPSAEMKIDPNRVVDLALGAGLKKVKQFEAGQFYYGIVFDKI